MANWWVAFLSKHTHTFSDKKRIIPSVNKQKKFNVRKREKM